MEKTVMKKTVRIVIITIFSILFLCPCTGAEKWERVVEKGFDQPSNDYAWSMSAFKGRLYVGTLNFLRGGGIWSSPTGDQDSWQMVYNSLTGSTIGVRNLYADGDQALYACTLSTNGANILRTTNGLVWVPVGKFFESRVSSSIRCVVRFGDYLYAGAGGNKAQMYRSKDGINWDQIRPDPGFGSTIVLDPVTGVPTVNNLLIGELAVFKNKLYAFTWTNSLKYQDILEGAFGYDLYRPGLQPASPGALEVWRSGNGTNWEKVVGKGDKYGNGMGFSLLDSDGMENDGVTSVTIFKDHLYLGTENDNAHTSVWRTSDGERWTKVLDFFGMGEENNYYAWRMIPFQDRLFVGTMNIGPTSNPGVTGAQIWVSNSGDAGTFYNIVHNGFDGETWSDGAGVSIPKNAGIRSFAIFNDTLFAGTATILSVPIPKTTGSPGGKIIAGSDIGCEIWRMIQY